METKTRKAVKFYQKGDLKNAFKLFATFKINITKDENRIITIAKEFLTGNKDFYTSLGFNETLILEQARKIIESKFIKS